jgi:hypothetical protein
MANCALHHKKLIGPSCDIRFLSFLDFIEPEESKLRNGIKKKIDFEIQAGRNSWKGEDVLDLRKGPTTTRANCALPWKKLIGPSCDIRFPSFLTWIEPEESKLHNEGKKIRFCKSGGEKWLKRWRCVRSEEGKDQHEGGLRPSPEKAHSSLVRYPISKFFLFNRTTIQQATQWKKKKLDIETQAGRNG